MKRLLSIASLYFQNLLRHNVFINQETMMTTAIPNIPFRNPSDKKVQCEVLSLQKLFRRNLAELPFPHRPNFYLILFGLSGSGQHTIDFQTQDYDGQTLLFIAENQVLRFHLQSQGEAWLIVFTREFLSEHPQDQ
jgi:AraC family transcriptional regulator, transcriptional activator of pobA